MSEEQVILVLCTFPNAEQARQIGTLVVERQLAACVNLVPGIESIYEWEGKVCLEAEVMGVFKTSAERFEALKDALVEVHPYEVPEVVALPVTKGSAPFLDWVRRQCVQ
jgi:periplasmic divalent cation tolerance protein